MSPSSGDAPIQLERYAELSAEAQLTPPLSALLAREAIDEVTWASAQAYWLARMADEARRQRFQTTTRYQQSFDRRRRALEAERRAKAASERGASAEPPAATARLAEVAPAPPALPVRAPERAASAPPPPPPVGWPTPSSRPHEAEAAPPLPVPPAPVRPEVPTPKRAPATMVGVVIVDPAEALPFREGPAVAPDRAQPSAAPEPSAPPRESAPQRRVDLGSTVYADPELVRAAATPFDAAPTTEPTPRRRVDLGATMMPSDELEAPALPFARPTPAERGVSVEARRPAAPLRADERMQAPIAGASSLGTTLPPTTQPVPGAAASSPQGSGRRFSINVFASLTAEIAENPSDVEAIRRRYGLGEVEHREESERWTAAFDADDELRKRYLGIVQRYRGYVRGQKKA